jgi:hypothetical protein
VVVAQLHYIKHMILLPVVRLVSVSVVIASLSACITTPEMKNRWSFVCSDDYTFDVVYARNKKSLKFTDADSDSKHKLQDNDENPESVAEPAVRYSNDEVVFEPAGVMAQVFIEGELRHAQCQGSAY